MAKLRSLAIVQAAIEGKSTQPTVAELHALGSSSLKGKSASQMFPGIATVQLATEGTGASIELRITKNQGIPIQLVKEGAAQTTPIVAVKSVDALGFYNLGRDMLAEKVGLTGMMTSAMIWHLNLQGDPDCHKEFVIGASRFHRYSQKCIERIKDALQKVDQAAIWQGYKERKAKVTKSASVPAKGQPVEPNPTPPSNQLAKSFETAAVCTGRWMRRN